MTDLAAQAARFAALGDATRLGVVARLLDGEAHSIARLTEGTALTRQAVTKHLGVLADAGLVRRLRTGRESRFQLEPRALAAARAYLEAASRQWDAALARLKRQVEDG